MKKQRLDPRAKRDFSGLDKEDKNKIYHWILKWYGPHKDVCPFGRGGVCIRGERIFPKCQALFPEIIKSLECPCHVLYVAEVVKIAREAVR